MNSIFKRIVAIAMAVMICIGGINWTKVFASGRIITVNIVGLPSSVYIGNTEQWSTGVNFDKYKYIKIRIETDEDATYNGFDNMVYDALENAQCYSTNYPDPDNSRQYKLFYGRNHGIYRDEIYIDAACQKSLFDYDYTYSNFPSTIYCKCGLYNYQGSDKYSSVNFNWCGIPENQRSGTSNLWYYTADESSSRLYFNIGDTTSFPTITRPGWTFVGWYPWGSKNELSPSDEKIYNARNLKEWVQQGLIEYENSAELYPVFYANQYSVNFNPGAGTLYNSAETYSWLYDTMNDSNTNITETPTPNDPYMTFDGWYYGSTKYTKYPSEGGNLTLTARYVPGTYSITYTGGVVNNPNPTSYTYKTGIPTLKDVSKPGYMFKGWYNGTTKVTGIDTQTGGNVTLRADFMPIDYNITYTGTEGAEEVVSAEASANPSKYNIEQSVTLNPLKKKGYTFNGWYNASGEAVTEIPVGSMGNQELEARFSLNTYNVTYKDVPEGVKNPNPTTYNYGTTVTLQGIDKTGHTFDGWFRGSEKVTELGSQDEDLELTAKYTPNTYKITYKDVPEGVKNSNPATYVYGKEVKLTDLSRDGYKFDGWYDAKGSKVDKILDTTLGDITLTPKFTAETYNITYRDVPAGVNNPNPSKYTYGQGVKLDNLTQSGYNFEGWYTVKNERITEVSKTSIGEVVLTAKFTKIEDKQDATDTKKDTTPTNTTPTNTTDNKTDNTKANTTATTYKITYKGVTSSKIKITNPNPSTYTYGKGLTLKNATATGYTFTGWYTSSGKKITSISKTAKGNAVLTAKWKKSSTATAPKVTGKKVSKAKSKITVSYKKATNVSGYQIQYTLNGKTKRVTTTKTKLTLNKKAKNVKVRTIVKSNGKTIYGSWC